MCVYRRLSGERGSDSRIVTIVSDSIIDYKYHVIVANPTVITQGFICTL